MSPGGRLAGGVFVLAVYAWALKPSPAALSAVVVENADVEKWLKVSDEAFEAGRYPEALDATQRLVERFPTQHVYAGRLARIYEKTGRPADEATAWERFIDLSPMPVDACPAIGNAYARAGDTPRSLDAFERCVSFDPRNSESLFFLGRAYERAGRNAEALARYSQAIALDPSGTDSQLGLGRLALRANRIAQARGAASAVLKGHRAHVDALLLAGLAAERDGRLQDARGFLERALAVAEAYVDVHIALGRVELAAGDRARARRHFERALQMDPARTAEIVHWLDRTAPETAGAGLLTRFAGVSRPAPPTFVYSLPQDLHVSAITREGSAPVDGSTYPGFYPSYASRVKRMDACFGSFIEDLKARGLFDRSIIIVTADHGDSLGEQGRLGHAYTIFPEIVQVPLIVHLPPALSAAVEADTSAPVFTTDLTPTLYALLGHEPAQPASFFGRPVFRRTDGRPPQSLVQPQLVASSYGSVYGTLLDDARRLYIFDGIALREYLYELDGTPAGRPLTVTNEDRLRGQRAIRDTVGEIGSFYGYRP